MARPLQPVVQTLQKKPHASAVLYVLLGLSTGTVPAQEVIHTFGESKNKNFQAEQASPKRRDYQIPKGLLSTSLAVFAKESGLLLSFDPDVVRDVPAPALVGSFTMLEGIHRLLEGSGLEVQSLGNGAYTIRRERSVQSGATGEATTMPSLLVEATRLREASKAVYEAPYSSAHLSNEELERQGRVSTADMLKGVAGVETGDARNGGALDVSIRGLQGQSRIAITVDGTRQALDTYRGYSGVQQRSYLDPGLISEVVVRKGAGQSASDMGAIGGSVDMRTLGIEDILLPGKNVGLRVKVDAWNNGIRPASRPQRYASTMDELLSTPRERQSNLFDSQSRSGNVAFAYAGEALELVLAYSRLQQGNYFAGRHGHSRYRQYDKENGSGEVDSVATNYGPGHEVLNSSNRTESFLFKGTLRPASGHTVDLNWRHFDGSFGEIMPSDIFRNGNAGIYQYPFSSMKTDSFSVKHNFDPAGNDAVNMTMHLWMTDAHSNQLNGVWGPASQDFSGRDRGWVPLDNRRIGLDISNRSVVAVELGKFNLDLSAAIQHERIRPQRGVIITEHDINANNILRNGVRRESALAARLEYEPTDEWQLWSGIRYDRFSSRDNNVYSTPIRERRMVRDILVRGGNDPSRAQLMQWFADENGHFTNATDPRLNNGIVFRDTNDPFNGVRYNDFGVISTEVFDEEEQSVITGYAHKKFTKQRRSTITPSLGLNYKIGPQSLLYTNLTTGVRLPSLFETSLGIWSAQPASDLKPEKSLTWEFGASTTQTDVFKHGDRGSAKLVYFRNHVKNYISRYWNPTNGALEFSNADSMRISGLEFQSTYDAGHLFAGLGATYYLKHETCDRTFAARLREYGADGLQDTPDCTGGSFMGAYSNMQSPPKSSLSLTLGTRQLAQRLILGTRINITSGPVNRADNPWQTSPTTMQLYYHPVTAVDLFASYAANQNLMFNFAVQNLTDRYYLDPLSQSLMPAPGRTIRLGMTARF